MSFRKIFAALVSGLILSLGLVTPAQAAYSDCSSYPGTVCMHQYSNYTGIVWRQYPSQINGCRNLAPDNFDNRAGTLFNGTTHHLVIAYQFANCGGNYFLANSGYAYAFSGGSENAWWNDRISSIEVIPL